jgi:FkbM family methyltransferase
VGKEFIAVYHGVKVPPNPLIGPYSRRMLKEGTYEAHEVKAALKLVVPGDRVLELGAGIGVTGAVVALNRFPERVLCYEPNPNLIEPILRLHALNGLEDVIDLENAVVLAGESLPPTARFNVRPNYIGSRLTARRRRAERQRDRCAGARFCRGQGAVSARYHDHRH